MQRALVIAAPILVIALVGIVLAATARDDRSYELGRKESLAAQSFFKAKCQAFASCSGDPEGEARASCAHVIKMSYSADVFSEGLVLDDMVAGCVDGMDLP